VVVGELSQALVDWSLPLAALTQGAIQDPRVTVEVVEVGAKLAKSEGRFDAVLLDVDNGPTALSRRGNQQLYSVAGLERAFRSLKPGGVLVVWSAGPDAAFLKRLRSAGFDARAKDVPAREGGGARHTLFIASRRTPERTPRTVPARPSGRRARGGRAR
jgi:spermidine synthase